LENKFKEIIISNKLEEKSINLFWKVFSIYMKDTEEEFKRVFFNYSNDKMVIEINKISFELGNWPECDYNHIVVYIPIVFDEKKVGYYEVYYTLDGKVDDDYFVTY